MKMLSTFSRRKCRGCLHGVINSHYLNLCVAIIVLLLVIVNYVLNSRKPPSSSLVLPSDHDHRLSPSQQPQNKPGFDLPSIFKLFSLKPVGEPRYDNIVPITPKKSSRHPLAKEFPEHLARPTISRRRLSKLRDLIRTVKNPIQIVTVRSHYQDAAVDDEGEDGVFEIKQEEGPRPKRKITRGRRKRDNNHGLPGTDSYYKIAEQLNAIIKVNKTAYKSRTCSKITGRRILMNYAHECCEHSQPLNCETGLENGFDICIQFSKKSIEPFFLNENKQIFDQPVTAGYGIWKSYLIMRLLATLDDDDVLFYSDSGAKFIDSAENHFCLMDERSQDVVVFSAGLPEHMYTKGDAFVISGCLTDDCMSTQQRIGGYSIYRKSMVSFHFLSMWLTFNRDFRFVSDAASQMKPDSAEFKGHRHDQSALSLASKLCGLPEWPDPTQWGEAGWNKMLRKKPEFTKIAKTVIDCTRDMS